MSLETPRTLRWGLIGAVALLAISIWLAQDSFESAAATPADAHDGVTPVEAPEPHVGAANEVELPGRRDVAAIAPPVIVGRAPQGRCIVSVVDPAGQPACGARLWIEDSTANQATLSRAARESESNVDQLANGLGFEIAMDANARALIASPVKAIRAAARAEGLAGWTVISRADTECVIELEPSHDIAVRVLDARGRPAQGAVVVLGLLDEWAVEISARSPAEQDLRCVSTTTTDADGFAWLRDVESKMNSNVESWRIAAPLIETTPAWIEVALADLPHSALEFAAKESGQLVFEVRDAGGRLLDVTGAVRVQPGISDDDQATHWRLSDGVDVALVGGRARLEHVALRRRFTATRTNDYGAGRTVQIEPLTRPRETRTAVFVAER